MVDQERGAMRMGLHVFHPDDGPNFEVWAPRQMRREDAPNVAGALIADEVDGFAPNLVIGYDRVRADMDLHSLAIQLEQDAAAHPGVELQAGRIVDGTAGEIYVIAFTRPLDGRVLYQMNACLLAPLPDDDDSGEPSGSGSGESGGSGGQDLAARDLVYLTGTCTLAQMPAWDPAFVSAASTVRFG